MEGNLVANHQNPEDRVEEVKARMIKELAVNGYNTKAEQQMLQRMKPENVAMLLQKSYMLAANTWSDASRAAARNALRSHGYSQHSYSNQQGGRETFAKGNHLVSLSQKGWKSHGVLAARTGLHGHGEKSGTLKAHLEGIHGKPTRNDGAGAGSAAGGSSAGGAPSGGSSNPADKMMAQRKARTPKKKRKPMNGVLAPNGTASY